MQYPGNYLAPLLQTDAFWMSYRLNLILPLGSLCHSVIPYEHFQFVIMPSLYFICFSYLCPALKIHSTNTQHYLLAIHTISLHFINWWNVIHWFHHIHTLGPFFVYCGYLSFALSMSSPLNLLLRLCHSHQPIHLLLSIAVAFFPLASTLLSTVTCHPVHSSTSSYITSSRQTLA